MTKNAVLVLALSLVGALPSGAIPLCSRCDCTRLCSTTCSTGMGLSTCGAQGVCSGSPDCSASRVDLFGGGQDALVSTDLQHGQAAARLTWRLSENVEATNLGAACSARFSE